MTQMTPTVRRRRTTASERSTPLGKKQKKRTNTFTVFSHQGSVARRAECRAIATFHRNCRRRGGNRQSLSHGVCAHVDHLSLDDHRGHAPLVKLEQKDYSCRRESLRARKMARNRRIPEWTLQLRGSMSTTPRAHATLLPCVPFDEARKGGMHACMRRATATATRATRSTTGHASSSHCNKKFVGSRMFVSILETKYLRRQDL